MSLARKKLPDFYGPHVVILASEQAKAMLAFNGLSPAEFFAPFGDFSKGKTFSISPSDRFAPATIQDLRLRFYDAERLAGLKNEADMFTYIFDAYKPHYSLNTVRPDAYLNHELLQA